MSEPFTGTVARGGFHISGNDVYHFDGVLARLVEGDEELAEVLAGKREVAAGESVDGEEVLRKLGL